MTPEHLAQIAAIITAVTALLIGIGSFVNTHIISNRQARKDELEALRVIIDEQGDRLTELENENRNLQVERIQLEQRINQLRTDLSAVQVENRTLCEKIEALERENVLLRAELDEYRSGKKTKTAPLKGAQG